MEKPAKLTELDDSALALERPRATLVEIVADKLREFILIEKLPPGAPISERDVAAALGISRTPMRGALALLERDGLVEYSVTRRPRVADPSLEDIADSLAVMGALEALAGELACQNASDEEIRQIVMLQQKMAEGSGTLEPIEFFRTDMKMHGAIVQASGNNALIDTHSKYNARLWRARFVSSRRSAGREQTLAEHTAIAEALTKRDAVATAHALRTHLVSAVTNISVALEERQNKAPKE
ncbi:GntR family transcriptional regulator [Nisaea sp.]|uniref:GntR family transcriptional regulator n=1 Tax=Nisaea sp. TaxID=2024842 RepID=UPI0032EC59AF